ncbi:MAG: phosphotransferase-like protein [Acidimicrobiales bacterium]
MPVVPGKGRLVSCDDVDVEAIFVSGPSGVGKTSILLRLQERLADPWLFFESDRCQPGLPARRELATTENDRAMTLANVRAVRAYVDAGFRILAELDVADDVGRLAVHQELGSRSRSLVLACSVETAVHRASTRSPPVSLDFVRAHAAGRDWEAANSDHVERTDARALDEVVKALCHWIEDAPIDRS